MNSFNYFVPTKILFGPGKLNELATVSLPGKKALLVISSGKSMKINGYLDRVVELLKKNNDTEVVIFDKIRPNPILDHVTEGAETARREKCDFVIGLGGGSSIDSAKSIAVAAKNPGNYWDYIHGGSGKGLPVKNGALPIVAVTTTAGTGTEADPWTVITKEDTCEKIGFGNEHTFPVLSIVDPELMLTVPPQLTVYQAFDAFFHAAEGYIAKTANPISDMFALKSINLINEYLPAAFAHGNDPEARARLALANTYSGFVESLSSCTSEHSMEHALSAVFPDLPHGAGLIMLSEAYFGFFADKVPQRFVDMARAMDENSEPTSGAFIKALMKLKYKCKVDTLKMSDYGIRIDDIPALARKAYDTMGGLFEADPYKLSPDETVAIMTKSFG